MWNHLKILIYSGIIRKNISNPDCYGADNPVTTSDESSDAMRIFAASPPDNYVWADHMFSRILYLRRYVFFTKFYEVEFFDWDQTMEKMLINYLC